GSARVASTLSAGRGSWTGTPTIDFGYQWQRCDAHGAGCVNIAGATGSTYPVAAADGGATLRVVVSAGNWISSVGQAPSAVTGVVPKVVHGARKGSGASSSKLALTKVKMSPRRFPVAHRHKRRGTRLDGSRITWRLNRAATVHLIFQRLAGSGKH